MPTQPPPGPWDSVGGQVGIIYPQLSCRGCAYMAVDWHLPAGGLPLGSGARSRISATSSSARPQLSPCRSYIPKTPIWREFRPRCDPISKRAFSRAVRRSSLARALVLLRRRRSTTHEHLEPSRLQQEISAEQQQEISAERKRCWVHRPAIRSIRLSGKEYPPLE